MQEWLEFIIPGAQILLIIGAAWSVLSNLFCALLIVIVGPFRLGDYIEVLDTAEKPGAKGRVIDINMLYTTLQDAHAPEGAPNLLQIPNSLIFQRVVKRWKGGLGADGEHATHGEEERAMRLTTPHDAQPSQPPLHTTN
jgi:small-conductance mechanosensitive channel